MDETHKYDDIINLERPISKKHPPMDAEARAAQFSPFKALTGLEDEVDDTAKQNEITVAGEIEREADQDYLEYLEKSK